MKTSADTVPTNIISRRPKCSSLIALDISFCTIYYAVIIRLRLLHSLKLRGTARNCVIVRRYQRGKPQLANWTLLKLLRGQSEHRHRIAAMASSADDAR